MDENIIWSETKEYCATLVPSESFKKVAVTFKEFIEGAFNDGNQYADFVLRQPNNILCSSKKFFDSMPEKIGDLLKNTVGRALEDIEDGLKDILSIKLIVDSQYPDYRDLPMRMRKVPKKSISIKNAKKALEKTSFRFRSLYEHYKNLSQEIPKYLEIAEAAEKELEKLKKTIKQKKELFKKFKKIQPNHGFTREIIDKISLDEPIKICLDIFYGFEKTANGISMIIDCNKATKIIQPLEKPHFDVWVVLPVIFSVYLKKLEIKEHSISGEITGNMRIGAKIGTAELSKGVDFVAIPFQKTF